MYFLLNCRIILSVVVATIAFSFSLDGYAEEKDDGVVSRGVRKVLTTSLENLDIYRQALHRWDRSVRGFRKDHNFSLLGGGSRGVWRLKAPSDTSTRSIDTDATYLKFQYSFHLQLVDGFGYYLGSSVGGVFNDRSNDKKYDLSRGISIPGVVVGLSMNMTPALRLMCGIEGYLERLEGLHFYEDSERKKVNITTQVLSAHIALDIFVRLGWAIRIEGEVRYHSYVSPSHTDDNSDLAMDLVNSESRYGIGIVYHLI